MSAPLSGARQARPNFFRRLVARAQAQELVGFVVPGPEVARAMGVDLEMTGLRISGTPRHASVLVLVGELLPGLKKAAAVAYAQMPRPRAILAVGAGDVSPLPGPDVSARSEQEDVVAAVAELRLLFAQSAFSPEAADFDVDAVRTRTEYVCLMHPEAVRAEPGSCPICGMDLVPREAVGGDGAMDHAGHGAHHEVMDHGDQDQQGVSHSEQDHEDHGSMEHVNADEEGAEANSNGHDHGGHGGHDHGDMGFMSMVEMTKDLPRSSDGLQMEWVEDVPFGPLFPGLPGGLALTLTLDGDTVARANVRGIEGRVSADDLVGPAETLADRLARLDPLSPVAYRDLALRALESAVAGIQPDERMVLARVSAVEKERAASHLGWLSLFGCLIGYHWLKDRAGSLQLALVRAADIDEVARLRDEAGRLSRGLERTPLLRRRLKGIGILPKGARPLGPLARARGVADDARADEEVYRSLGFEPVVREGDDALSRLKVRLGEVEQSLDLLQRVGEIALPEPTKYGELSGEGSAMVETPRGAATLRVTLEGGAVNTVELDEPTARHLGLVASVTEQRELADALFGVASLDPSPWGVAQ